MAIINICILSIGVSTFIKQTLKGIENQAGNDMIVHNFNTLSFKLKINKETRYRIYIILSSPWNLPHNRQYFRIQSSIYNIHEN